jgi:hypothetical protein
MVEALEDNSTEGVMTIPLGSMEDLIKVADELAKPVVYRKLETQGDPQTYFVLDVTTLYRYSTSGDSKIVEH